MPISKTTIVCIAIGIVLIILSFVGIFRPIGDAARWLFLPVVRTVSQTTQEAVGWLHGASRTSEQDRIAQLEERVRLFTTDQVACASLERENGMLRAQAHFLEESGYDSVGARVISREIGSIRARVTIDRGARDGIETGQAVVADGGLYVGKILTVRERIAVVELFTDPEARTAAAPLAKPRLLGVIEGRGNGAALLTYIPSSEELSEDQIVVTAGTEEKVSGHLPVGIVNVVNGKPTDPFYTAALEPLADLERMPYVSVLRPTALAPEQP